MNIIAWNVNGYDDKIHHYVTTLLEGKPDILFLSETKKNKDYLVEKLKQLNYNYIINAHNPSCNHGVVMLIKNTLNYEEVKIDLGIESRRDSKSAPMVGRIIAIKVNNTTIIGSYTPNSGGYKDEKKFNYRTNIWDPAFYTVLEQLRAQGPTIWIGDINVAPNVIDVSTPTTMCKWAGFCQEERDNIHKILNGEWVDVWRHFNPTNIQYTWVSYPHKVNYGLRLDNIIVSKDLLSHIQDTTILTSCTLSDHLPITITINI